ncbi:MAG: hypothetical protein UU21_C0019G0008 [Candidatus Levybacteria bacterium GW2011_GWA2_40_8]|nr:MAG: hypothetical protein UU21_C0019G0008 [Candidatus Levybacteria bacterium GW2011_GWA2_40_8]
MRLLNFSQKAIEYLFYALFFLVPIVFLGSTSELFELNKIWLTYSLAILIALFWGIKIIANKRLLIRRTPLDIPILLFLSANILSTIFSWDPYVSFWGYYSRFNGGLLSIITYIFLYYAFVSSFEGELKKVIRNLLGVSLLSGLFVSLWGLPSHFGYDPTCLLFRGTLDVSCWTEQFQPKVRIFSTMGQPAWLAAYLSILLPISLSYAISSKNALLEFFEKLSLPRPQVWSLVFFGSLSSLFFLDILYTNTRSGILAMLLSLIFFVSILFFLNRTSFKKSVSSYKKLWVILLIFALIGFIVKIPLPYLEKVSLENLKQTYQNKEPAPAKEAVLERTGVALGGTDSGRIRSIVWRGAIDIFRANPILGTGVETFAYSYYKYRPIEHNLTSEYDYLYNKAHNEYLNYLATTGILGFLSYFLIIAVFVLRTKKAAFDAIKLRFPLFDRFPKTSESTMRELKDPINFSLLAAFLTILVTNFFGFSVVIVNIYLFFLPLFFFGLTDMLGTKRIERTFGKAREAFSQGQKVIALLLTVLAFFLIFILGKQWIADKNYALGYNLSRAGQYEQAYSYLLKATSLRGEPVFQDELSVNSAILASFVLAQGAESSTESANLAGELIQNAINSSDELVASHPRNIVFWKSRVRIFYNLSQVDPSYLPKALEAMKKVHELGPTEASISYNLGVLYGQNGEVEKAVKELERTVRLKPDYRDAWYALGIFYHELAINDAGQIQDKEIQKKAEDALNYILKNINIDDETVLQTLESWQNL